MGCGNMSGLTAFPYSSWLFRCPEGARTRMGTSSGLRDCQAVSMDLPRPGIARHSVSSNRRVISRFETSCPELFNHRQPRPTGLQRTGIVKCCPRSGPASHRWLRPGSLCLEQFQVLRHLALRSQSHSSVLWSCFWWSEIVKQRLWFVEAPRRWFQRIRGSDRPSPEVRYYSNCVVSTQRCSCLL